MKVKVKATADFFDKANNTKRIRGQEFDLKQDHVPKFGKLVEPVQENKQKSEKEIKIEESRKKYHEQAEQAKPAEKPFTGIDKVNPK